MLVPYLPKPKTIVMSKHKQKDFTQWITEKGFDAKWEYRQQPIVSAESEAYAQGAQDAWQARDELANERERELVGLVESALKGAPRNHSAIRNRVRYALDQIKNSDNSQ